MFASGVNRVTALPPKSRAHTAGLKVGEANVSGSAKHYQVSQDMILDDSDDDNGPGPGQYYNPDQSTAFHNKSKAASEGGV